MVETTVWNGTRTNVSFMIKSNTLTEQDEITGKVFISVDGLEICKIYFVIDVINKRKDIKHQIENYNAAFISYASEDTTKVLERLQAIQKLVPHIQFFFDKLSLQSGQKWEDQLYLNIEESDIFYLFWSRAAAKSEWVRKEWRYALSLKGLDFIDPFPLELPEIAPPPEELCEKHFSDWTMQF